MRGSEQPRSQAALSQNGLCHGASRPFPLRPCHVNDRRQPLHVNLCLSQQLLRVFPGLLHSLILERFFLLFLSHPLRPVHCCRCRCCCCPIPSPSPISF